MSENNETKQDNGPVLAAAAGWAFFAMTVDEAIEYCYANQRQYVYDCGNGGQRQFDCLIAILEDGTISPSELPDYGMDYGMPNSKPSER